MSNDGKQSPRASYGSDPIDTSTKRVIFPDDPPTAKQLKYLGRLYSTPQTPKTKQEASDLIDHRLEELSTADYQNGEIEYGD